MNDEPPSAANSMTASQVAVRESGGRKPRRTGLWFRSTRIAGTLHTIWQKIGLALGRHLAFVVRDDHAYIILMAVAVGIASGAAAGALLWWIGYAVGAFPRPSEGHWWLRWMVLLVVPTVGGLLAGLLRTIFVRLLLTPPAASVHDVITAIARRGGTLRGYGAIAAGLGTGLTIGSGGSCGHEGPSVAIGATVGSVLARFFGLRARRHMAMVGAGCAGGLAAAFNAPLAGVIFTVELVFGGAIGGDIGTMSVFIPLIVSAVSATFTAHFIRGDETSFHLLQHSSPGVAELGFYVVMAALAGLIGSLMSRTVLNTQRLFERLSLPRWLKPAVGGLAVGCVAALWTNEILGAGHSTVDRAVHGELLWESALLLLALKVVVTSLTLGSGGFGGILMPALYVGACLGTIVGTLSAFVLGSAAQDPGAYALVGMGAIFAALMHSPLTAIVMLFELTHDYGIILPLMLACILSVAVARRIHPLSFYRLVLQNEGVIVGADADREVMQRRQVLDLMIAPECVLAESADLEQIRRITLASEMGSTFVVDGESRVTGFVNGNQLARAMLRGEIQSDSVARDFMGQARLLLLHSTDNLAGAVLAFARSGQDVLPIVDGERHLIGIVRLRDVLSIYSDKVLNEQDTDLQVHSPGGALDQELELGKGLVLDRMVVGRAWSGRTLTELNLRNQTGVSVLELCRDGDIVAVDPRAPLCQGDVVAICGTREQLLRARIFGSL